MAGGITRQEIDGLNAVGFTPAEIKAAELHWLYNKTYEAIAEELDVSWFTITWYLAGVRIFITRQRNGNGYKF